MDDRLPATSNVSAGMAAAAQAAPDYSGRAIGDFRLLRRLGQGGMGQVYLAEQLSLKRKVAIKIMRADLAANPIALKRFQQEAEAVARVPHANIVQIHAIGASDGLHYMALEYIEGRNLRDFVNKKGPPDLLLGMSIMRQVAAALEQAHEAGIIHRDIKPENILLTRKLEAKVADFGLSRCFGTEQQAINLTQTGVSMGTPLYMSPEQVLGKEVDPRTDIYSFGVTSYFMWTGQPPFKGQSPFEVAVQHVQNQAAPLGQLRPDLPGELSQLVHKMMAKEPGERFQTSRELLAVLLQLRQGMAGIQTQGVPLSGPVPMTASTVLAAPAVTAPRRGWRVRAAMLLALVLALILGAGLRAMRGTGVPVKQLSAAGEAVRVTAGTSREASQRVAFAKDVRDSKEFQQNIEAALQLGLLYLEERRLLEADAFFKQLRDQPPTDHVIYGVFGRLGHAMVLAFQNKAEESNRILVELEKNKLLMTGEKVGRFPPPELRGIWAVKTGREFVAEYFLLSIPQVRRLLAEALNRNAANLGDSTLPEPLERLRKIPRPPAKPAAPERSKS